jgi:hypothetical protein
MTLEELQTKRDSLIGRIADAVKAQTMGDKSITFQDIDQMQKSLAILDNEIASASSTRSSRVLLVQYSNG